MLRRSLRTIQKNMKTPSRPEKLQGIPPASASHPSFGEAFLFWLKLGFISFGGPTGQIAIMHTELVEKRKWISEARFLHALNYCMLLPGPEAQQLATYVGWLLHKTWGGIVAGAFFVIPSIFILWTLSYIYVTLGNLPWIAAIFYVHVPFPLIIISAAHIGFFGGKWKREKFLVIRGHGKAKDDSVLDDSSAIPEHAKPSWKRALRVCITWILLWWAPVVLASFWLGSNHTVVREGILFSIAAVVTFGGAYAVLPYVAQQAVQHYGWLSAGQMLDGLGLAETTPGPLIIVTQFVGFHGAWDSPGQLPPILSATLGALVTTWTTFVPCFLWIFLGGPHIEALRGNEGLTTTLSAVTAAVVGVVLNLAVWFGLHVIFPSANVVDWFAVIVGLAAFVAMIKWKLDI